MAVRKVASNLQVLTPELARHFANMAPLPGERDCKPKRISFFKRHLEQGTFLDPTWPKGVCRSEDNKEYRLDGQHQSRVLADLADEMDANPNSPLRWPDLMVTVDVYEFDSIYEDAALLFEKFDNPESVRDDIDMIHFDKAHHADMVEIDKRFVDKVGKAILFYNRELANPDHAVLFSKRRKGLYFDEPQNREFAHWLYQFVGAKHDWLIAKAAIVAEAYNDFLFNRVMATEFWGWVFKENHPDVTHESRELTATLKEWTRATKKRSPMQYYKRTKQAWDRYRRFAQAAETESRPPATPQPEYQPTA